MRVRACVRACACWRDSASALFEHTQVKGSQRRRVEEGGAKWSGSGWSVGDRGWN